MTARADPRTHGARRTRRAKTAIGARALAMAVGLIVSPHLACSRAPAEAPLGIEAAIARDEGHAPLDASAGTGSATRDASAGVQIAWLDASTEIPGAPLDASPDAPGALPPIPDQPLFTNLTIPGFPDAVVALPNGASTPRPVLIVLHGSGDRPDWNCDAWRHITSDRGFVLCPRGDYVPRESGPGDDRRYTHRGGAYLQRHVDAALSALAARFAGYVDVERPAVAGFSLGATEVLGLAARDPARFPRVAEIEGGQDAWNAASIRAFASGGGQRVLFGCGSSWCMPAAKSAIARLRAGGVDARVVHASVGHTTDPPLQEALMVEIGWFLDGDARWGTAP